MIDLLPYCETDRQRECVQAVAEHGSNTKAAAALGVGRRSIDKVMARVEKAAASSGYAPGQDLNRPVAPGFTTKRVSTAKQVTFEDGSTGYQWHIQEPEKKAIESMMARMEDYRWKPAPVIPTKGPHNADLLTLYTLTDFHLGCYAYGAETGDDWDLNIATKEAIAAITGMADGSPSSHTGIFNVQGDFLHWDGLLALTPASKHVLDADTRYGKLVEMAFDVIMAAVEILLRKHKQVKIIVCEGNHDEAGSIWIRKGIKKIYRNNKRVEMDDTEFPYYAHLHGEIMLAFHHGHKTKNKSLPALFSSEPRYRRMWGMARYTYVHTGHYHHAEQDMAEFGGAIVERHPTLAGRDAYAARHGYVSWRAAHAITYHISTGEHCRVTVTPKFKEVS